MPLGDENATKAKTWISRALDGSWLQVDASYSVKEISMLFLYSRQRQRPTVKQM